VLHHRNPQLADDLGLEAVNVKPDEHLAESIAVAREHGLHTLTVTADARWIRDALAAGVDIVLTDDLELLAELQDEACANQGEE
jgi:glycerophosphoryl diester phosphodiesterase